MNNPPTETTRYRCAEEADAMQWTGSNAEQLRAFCGSDFDTIDPEDRSEDPDETAAVRSHKHGGWLGLADGDWVVKHADHFSVASDEEFRARWSPAGLVAVPPTATEELTRLRAVVARLRQMADHWEQQLPEVIRTPAVVSAIRAALEAADNPSRLPDVSEDTTTTRAALERVRTVLETEAVVGRSALEYRGLITSALMADGARQPETQPVATAYGDGLGRTFCLRCPRPAEPVPLTIEDVDHWELCPSCGRHVVNVARDTAVSAGVQAVCKCPAEVCVCGHHAGAQTDEETSR